MEARELRKHQQYVLDPVFKHVVGYTYNDDSCWECFDLLCNLQATNI